MKCLWCRRTITDGNKSVVLSCCRKCFDYFFNQYFGKQHRNDTTKELIEVKA